MTKQHWIWTRHEICNTCTMCCIAHMWRMKIWQRCRCPLDMTACLAMLITVVIIITSNSNRRQLSGVWTNWTFNIYSNELTQIDGYVWEARTGILVHARATRTQQKKKLPSTIVCIAVYKHQAFLSSFCCANDNRLQMPFDCWLHVICLVAKAPASCIRDHAATYDLQCSNLPSALRRWYQHARHSTPKRTRTNEQ